MFGESTEVFVWGHSGCWIERSKLRGCFFFYISGENYPLTHDKCNEAP